MYFELVEVADELLEYGLVNSGVHSDLVTELYEKDEYSADDAVRFSLFQSICDVIRVVGSHGFDEEHITANLTGSLSANLSWFARTYRRAGGTETLPHFQWVHQSKRSEARSGIDFGILARIPGGDSVRAWRLLVVQAKLGNPRDQSIAIDHVTKGKPKADPTDNTVEVSDGTDGTEKSPLADDRDEMNEVNQSKTKPPLSDDGFEIFGAAIISKAAKDCFPIEDLKNAHAIASRGFEPWETRYQLETILRTDLRGRMLAKANPGWCFYAGWFPKGLPLAVDVRTLAYDCIRRKSDRPKRYWFDDRHVDFIDLLRQTIFLNETPYGLGPIDIHAIQIMAAARCTKP